MQEWYYRAKSDKWLKGFAVFCRIALAAGFLPSGLTKIMGERFVAGLPHNNPLGHYFDALYLTGYYYTFIGIAQLLIAVLLLFPKTSLLGALMYFPVIINICVLTYATRFDGTRLVTMMVLANPFLLVWNYDRLQYIFGFPSPAAHPPPVTIKPLSKRHRFIFFGAVFTVVAFIIIGTSICMKSYRVIQKRSAAISVLPVKLQPPAKFSAIVFTSKANR